MTKEQQEATARMVAAVGRHSFGHLVSALVRMISHYWILKAVERQSKGREHRIDVFEEVVDQFPGLRAELDGIVRIWEAQDDRKV